MITYIGNIPDNLYYSNVEFSCNVTKVIQIKTARYLDSQIISILRGSETDTPVPELCREHCISNASFYKWRAKYGGMDASLLGRMTELEAENNRLNEMYADVWL